VPASQSTPEISIQTLSRWVSIPAGTWHQAVVPDEDWVVVSFHTVPEDELIEERPDRDDAGSTRLRTYLGSNA
jgi:hypothetical protein